MFLSLKNEFEKVLPEKVRKYIELSSNIAEDFGTNIYLIGGVVRDFVMHNQIKDIDIAVEGDAVDFAHFLSSKIDCSIVQTQENLRTAKIKFDSDIEIDFASTREEKYSKSGILPVAHNFGCKLSEDVKRRDFTINTLALKLTFDDKYTLIDYYGGYNDILNKKIKFLHQKSFIDDPSRIIRALKFKERFNFDLDSETYYFMQDYLKHPDCEMPLERIKSELKQYFTIEKSNLYSQIIKSNAYKLVSDNPIAELNENRLNEMLDLGIIKASEIWLIYFLHLLINSDFAVSRLNLTSFESKVLNQTRELLSIKLYEEDNLIIYKRYSNTENIASALFYLISGDRNVIKYHNELKEIKVFISGQDLINLGLTPSKYFSILFDELLRKKLEGSIRTKEEEIDYVINKIKKEGK